MKPVPRNLAQAGVGAAVWAAADTKRILFSIEEAAGSGLCLFAARRPMCRSAERSALH
jgi:hypothetical protein